MKSIVWIFDSVLVFFSVAIGFYLGLAGLLMAELVVAGAWASVIMLTVFCILLFLVVAFGDIGFDRFIPSGIKAAPAGTERTNKYERRRKRNGWIGFCFGVFVALVASIFMPPEQIIELF